jgi:hypothetical protein
MQHHEACWRRQGSNTKVLLKAIYRLQGVGGPMCFIPTFVAIGGVKLELDKFG